MTQHDVMQPVTPPDPDPPHGCAPRLPHGPPLETSRRAYIAGLLGAIGLALAAGIQFLIVAFIFLGPQYLDRHAMAQLTLRGRDLVRPERDLQIYIIGLPAILALMLAMAIFWRYRARRLSADSLDRFGWFSAILHGALACASVAAFVVLLTSRCPADAGPRNPNPLRHGAAASDWLVLILPGLAALTCAMIDTWLAGRQSTANPRRRRPSARIARVAMDILLPAFIALTVIAPPDQWKDLAGRCLGDDYCHHLSFYAMGPALAYHHGAALCRETYSQYGIGWPLIFGNLPRSGLTYANIIGIGMIYASIYYIALYLLARALCRSAAWAAVAVLLALSLNMFSGIGSHVAIWEFPSATVMRSAADVWFFLALLGHLRHGNWLWILLAGAAAGAGLVFGSDTGLYLPPVFALYLLLAAITPGHQTRPMPPRQLLINAILFCLATATLLLAAAFAANRGALPGAAFWRGWVESLTAYAGSGIGMLPIAGVDDHGLIFFLAMLAVYLWAMARPLVHALHGNHRDERVLLACIAAHGLLLLIYFVGRSHPYNLFHVAAPWAIVLVALLASAHQAAGGWPRSSSIPIAALIVLLAALLTKGEFQSYPSLLGRACASSAHPIAGNPDKGIEMVQNDLLVHAGTRSRTSSDLQDLPAASTALRELARRSGDVAILDRRDCVLYYAAGLKPWSRYTPHFDFMMTRDQVRKSVAQLLAKPPRFAVIAGECTPQNAAFADVWEAFHKAVASRCRHVSTAAGLEIWERAESPGTNAASSRPSSP